MEAVQATYAGPSERARVRDAALLRISRTRRWLLAGAALLTAALAALASALLPGKSLGAKSHTVAKSPITTSATSSSVTPPLPAPANAAQLGIQGSGAAQPVPAPQPAPQPQAEPQPAPSGGAVVSGGS
jgi:cell division septation protein DedD